MAIKDGLNLSPRSIGIVIVVTILGLAGAGMGGFSLSSDAATTATEVMQPREVRAVVVQTIEELDSTMTLDEAETWRAEKDRMRHVDDTLIKHGKALEKVQRTVDGHTEMLQAIADEVGVTE